MRKYSGNPRSQYIFKSSTEKIKLLVSLSVWEIPTLMATVFHREEDSSQTGRYLVLLSAKWKE